MNNLIKFIGVKLIALQMVWTGVLMLDRNDYLDLFNMKINIKNLMCYVGLGFSLYAIHSIDNFKL